VASDLEQAVDGIGRAGTVDLEGIQRQLWVFGEHHIDHRAALLRRGVGLITMNRQGAGHELNLGQRQSRNSLGGYLQVPVMNRIEGTS
jgi:hypothetical protein